MLATGILAFPKHALTVHVIDLYILFLLPRISPTPSLPMLPTWLGSKLSCLSDVLPALTVKALLLCEATSLRLELVVLITPTSLRFSLVLQNRNLSVDIHI